MLVDLVLLFIHSMSIIVGKQVYSCIYLERTYLGSTDRGNRTDPQPLFMDSMH